MQHVFRVGPSHTKSRKRSSLNTSGAARPRRTHQKSRLGCRNCKQRRVKCDEDREKGCRNCWQHGIDCDYLEGAYQGLPGVSVGTLTPSSTITPTSTTTLDTSVPSEESPTQMLIQLYSPNVKLYSPMSYVSPFVFQQPEDMVPVLQTMSYFELFTCPTVTSTAGLTVFQDSIHVLSHQRDYLMHAMLGMAAAHLSESETIAQNPRQLQRFRRTELYHWHHAIRLYRAELATQAATDHVDSLITTCMLLSIYNFYMKNSTEESFVDVARSQRQASLKWLTVPLGFRVVLRHVDQYITASAWFDLLNESAPADERWMLAPDPTKGIFAAFLDLCSIDSSSQDPANPYQHALQELFALIQIEQLSIRDFAQLMAFMGRLDGQFQLLLVDRDSRALLIMLYWLMLLDRLDLWWAKTRTTSEGLAIIKFLEGSGNAKVQALLDIPKIAFGCTAGVSSSNIE